MITAYFVFGLSDTHTNISEKNNKTCQGVFETRKSVETPT